MRLDHALQLRMFVRLNLWRQNKLQQAWWWPRFALTTLLLLLLFCLLLCANPFCHFTIQWIRDIYYTCFTLCELLVVVAVILCCSRVCNSVGAPSMIESNVRRDFNVNHSEQAVINQAAAW